MRFSNTSDDRAGNGRRTIIDEEYSDYRVLANELGLGLNDGHPTSGFSRERDWFFNAKGRNVHPGGRWLVTLAHSDPAGVSLTDPDPEAPATGWLLAYEINPDDRKTNRVLVLAGPWNLHTDKALFAKCPLSDPDLDELMNWFRGCGM